MLFNRVVGGRASKKGGRIHHQFPSQDTDDGVMDNAYPPIVIIITIIIIINIIIIISITFLHQNYHPNKPFKSCNARQQLT